MSDKVSNIASGGCIVLVILAVGGYSEFSERREAKLLAAKEARETSERAAAEQKALAQSIELAKNARTLVKGQVFTSKPSPETTTNDFQLRRIMSEMKGELRIIGWQAKRHDSDTFVVTYSYESRGETRGFPFEVNVTAGVVRAIIGDPELEQKYGWRVGG